MRWSSTDGLASAVARGARIPALLLCASVLLAVNAPAFNTPLQPEDVEDAYSLGQSSNHEELADFLKQYQRDFKYPPDNPVAYVQSVEFQTPYEQIVLRSMRGGARYDKFQAEEAYRAHPSLVLVRVVVALRINYSGPVPPADSFQVLVSQAKSIEPRKIANTVLCDPYSQINYPYSVNRDCSTYVRELVLHFDAEQFAPGRATIKVVLPYDRSLETEYNLNKLK
jgi:hypothetical protein